MLASPSIKCDRRRDSNGNVEPGECAWRGGWGAGPFFGGVAAGVVTGAIVGSAIASRPYYPYGYYGYYAPPPPPPCPLVWNGYAWVPGCY
jgi:hypothetical protein